MSVQFNRIVIYYKELFNISWLILINSDIYTLYGENSMDTGILGNRKQCLQGFCITASRPYGMIALLGKYENVK